MNIWCRNHHFTAMKLTRNKKFMQIQALRRHQSVDRRNVHLQVRATVLSTPELLSLAVLSSSVLPPCTRGKAFGPSQVFLSAEGEVHVSYLLHLKLKTRLLHPNKGVFLKNP